MENLATILEPKIKWDANKKVECPCGGRYSLRNKSIHLNQLIHLQWIQKNLTLEKWTFFASDFIVPEELIKRYNKFFDDGNYNKEFLTGDFKKMLIDNECVNDGNCVDDQAFSNKKKE